MLTTVATAANTLLAGASTSLKKLSLRPTKS